MIIRICDNCGCEIETGKTRYKIRVDIYAAYDTLQISEEDLNKDHLVEIAKLIKKIEEMDPQEVSAEVHEAVEMDLCQNCRKLFHRQLTIDKRRLLQLLLDPNIYGRN